jgi:hypothetical protein
MSAQCSVMSCNIESESYIFISYAHHDAEIVFPILEAVSARR